LLQRRHDIFVVFWVQCRVSTSAVVTLGCLPELQVLCLADTRVKPFAVEKLQAMNRNLEVKGVKMPEKH